MPDDASPYADHFFLRESKNNSWANMFVHVPDGARVLDVGCSTGNFGEALEQLKGCTVIGVDLTEGDVAEARTRISEAYVLDIASPEADAAHLGTFDVILFADVLEHLVDPVGVLRRLRTMLAEGGTVVYSIPNMAHLSVRLDLLEGHFSYSEVGLLDRTHLHFYDGPEIARMFAAAGYRMTAENPVVLDYPDRWIVERLGGDGLIATDRFLDLVRASEADVFQHVGVAAPDPTSDAVEPRRPRVVMPPDEILAFANGVVAENEALRNEDAKTAKIQELERELAAKGSVIEDRDREIADLIGRIRFVRDHPVRFVRRAVGRRLGR